MKRTKLIANFTHNLNPTFRNWVGAEIETHFADLQRRRPISVARSQLIFEEYIDATRDIRSHRESGNPICKKWNKWDKRGALITTLHADDGTKVLYELGRQNIEVATAPCGTGYLLTVVGNELRDLYFAAERSGARPLTDPIIDTDEDLLVIPDERDSSWLKLDGREALALLAKTASVQFTFETKGPEHAIRALNILADEHLGILEQFPYPQDKLWREYISTSKAGYRADRYGIVRPSSINNYVDMLAEHDVVVNGELVPFTRAKQDVDVFLRSVWWNFRLRRYSDRLCLEVRTLARTDDENIELAYKRISSIMRSTH